MLLSTRVVQVDQEHGVELEAVMQKSIRLGRYTNVGGYSSVSGTVTRSKSRLFWALQKGARIPLRSLIRWTLGQGADRALKPGYQIEEAERDRDKDRDRRSERTEECVGNSSTAYLQLRGWTSVIRAGKGDEADLETWRLGYCTAAGSPSSTRWPFATYGPYFQVGLRVATGGVPLTYHSTSLLEARAISRVPLTVSLDYLCIS